MQTSDEIYAKKKLHLYEIVYLDGKRETVQAHDMHFSGGSFAGMFHALSGYQAAPEPRMIVFYRHPIGVVLQVREDLTASARCLTADPVEG